MFRVCALLLAFLHWSWWLFLFLFSFSFAFLIVACKCHCIYCIFCKETITAGCLQQTELEVDTVICPSVNTYSKYVINKILNLLCLLTWWTRSSAVWGAEWLMLVPSLHSTQADIQTTVWLQISFCCRDSVQTPPLCFSMLEACVARFSISCR